MAMKKFTECSKWTKWTIREKLGAVLFAAAAVLLFYSCYYADFYETGLEGVRFWDILFEGKIRSFYSQVFLIGNTQYVPLYDFPMYIIFALWNFPLWVVESISGIDIYHSTLCLMWMKSMLLFFLCLFLAAFRRLIGTVAGIENAGRAVSARYDGERMTADGSFLFLTSAFFMTGLVVLGQYDIIALTFMMMGLRAYLEGDNRRFTLWFAAASPLKYFSLLIYVPLVLLREKRIRRILLQGIAAVLPVLFFWIAVPYGRAELLEGCVYSTSSSGTNVAKPVYDALFVTGTVGFGTLFVYVFVWVIFLFLCYCRPVGEKEGCRLPVYVCWTAYMLQFTFGYSHPYWLILMEPFMILLILLDEEHRYLSLLLELVGTAAMAVAQIFTYTWCFNSGIVNLSFWRYLLPSRATGEEYSVMTVLGFYVSDERLQDYASGIGLSVYAACILLFAWLHYPLRRREPAIFTKGRECDGWLLPLRAFVVLCLGMVPVLLYVLRAVAG